MRTPDATAARKRATADRHGGIGSRVAPGSVRTVHRPGPIRGTPPGVGTGQPLSVLRRTGTTAGADRGTPPEPGTRRPLSVLRR